MSGDPMASITLPADTFEALAFAVQAEVELAGDTAHMTVNGQAYTARLGAAS